MKKTIALIIRSESMEKLVNIQNCHNESEALRALEIEEIEDWFVFDNASVNNLKRSKSVMLPKQEVFSKIKKRREKSADLASLSYYNVFFPYYENDNQDEVSLTMKIPKSIHSCLKKISYFSGKSMKEIITSAIAYENFELNKFLLEEEFDVDPNWYDLVYGDEDYFGMRIK